eukprot:g5041.t1
MSAFSCLLRPSCQTRRKAVKLPAWVALVEDSSAEVVVLQASLAHPLCLALPPLCHLTLQAAKELKQLHPVQPAPLWPQHPQM